MWTGIHCKLPVVDWLRSNIDYLDWPLIMLHTKGRFKKAISTEPKPTHWPFLSALQPLVTLSVLLNTTQGRGSEFLQRQQQNLKIPYIPFHPKTGKKKPSFKLFMRILAYLGLNCRYKQLYFDSSSVKLETLHINEATGAGERCKSLDASGLNIAPFRSPWPDVPDGNLHFAGVNNQSQRDIFP